MEENKVLHLGCPTSLGEILNFKFYLDLVKSQYNQITIGFQKSLWDIALHTENPDWPQKKALWNNFLDGLGKLFFSETPYLLEDPPRTYTGAVDMLIQKIGVNPQKSELAHILCKGTPLNIGEEYIVLTTKVREADQHIFTPLSLQLWQTLSELSKKYRIVILGERVVEMRKEYLNKRGTVFGLYYDAMCNLPINRIVDFTVPALGETVSTVEKLQQDCLIMNKAKAVITVGIGGNFALSTSVSNMAIGFRTDNNEYTDAIFHNREYPNAIITKDWKRFLEALRNL